MQLIKDHIIEVIIGIYLVYLFFTRETFFLDILHDSIEVLIGSFLFFLIGFILYRIKKNYNIENFFLKLFAIYAVIYFLYIFATKNVLNQYYKIY